MIRNVGLLLIGIGLFGLWILGIVPAIINWHNLDVGQLFAFGFLGCIWISGAGHAWSPYGGWVRVLVWLIVVGIVVGWCTYVGYTLGPDWYAPAAYVIGLTGVAGAIIVGVCSLGQGVRRKVFSSR